MLVGVGQQLTGVVKQLAFLPLRQIAVGENALIERMDNAFWHKAARVSKQD